MVNATPEAGRDEASALGTPEEARQARVQLQLHDTATGVNKGR
jgi:hypothetical protein